jgi:hypothetical protein
MQNNFRKGNGQKNFYFLTDGGLQNMEKKNLVTVTDKGLYFP